LYEGEVPTTGQLETDYSAAQETHGDLVRSSVRQVPLPPRWSESSAGDMNTFVDSLGEDLDVIFKALVSVTETSVSFLSEWNSRAASLEKRLGKLKNRVESLVLLKKDTAGYLTFVEDGFESLENVGSDTTAFIDTDTGEVSLNVDKTQGSDASQGTLINISDAKVALEVINRETVVKSNYISGLDNLRDVLSDASKAVGINIGVNNTSRPVLVELKLSLTSLEEVSKVVLITTDSGRAIPITVTLQYSKDGYTWANVPAESPIQSGRGNFIFRFPKTELQYIKFIVSKTAPDITETQNGIAIPVYSFVFNQVKLYSQVFDVPEAGVDLYTETLTPQRGGENVSFGQASLEVCEENWNQTSIDYYLRAYDGSSFTNWIKVLPLNRKRPDTGITRITSSQGSAVVDFSAPQESNSENLTTKFNSSGNTESLNLSRTNITYRFGGPNDTVANFYIPLTDNFLTDFVFVRNIGYTDSKFPTLDADLTIAGVECGWGLIGDGTYYCAFWVLNPEGRDIDFGETRAEIDRRIVSGLVHVKQGWHTFKTNKGNWIALSGTSNPLTEDDLRALDPQYPFNHKYLIEGFDYSSSYKGKKVYTGVDLYGQYSSGIQSTSQNDLAVTTRVGTFDLLGSGLDLSIFATDVINSNKTIVLLKTDSSRPSYENERVRLFYTRRFDDYTGLQLRANLKTDDKTVTPTLSYYRIKVK
jgi:hypothetical protein